MTHYAKIQNKDPRNPNIVEKVIVAEQDHIDYLIRSNRQDRWVQTSYNTRRGVHVLGGTPLRKNFAGIGYTYDEVRDAFIPPKPFNSWTLNEDTCVYDPPTPHPNDDKTYVWNEDSVEWSEVT